MDGSLNGRVARRSRESVVKNLKLDLAISEPNFCCAFAASVRLMLDPSVQYGPSVDCSLSMAVHCCQGEARLEHLGGGATTRIQSTAWSKYVASKQQNRDFPLTDPGSALSHGLAAEENINRDELRTRLSHTRSDLCRSQRPAVDGCRELVTLQSAKHKRPVHTGRLMPRPRPDVCTM